MQRMVPRLNILIDRPRKLDGFATDTSKIKDDDNLGGRNTVYFHINLFRNGSVRLNTQIYIVNNIHT